jgi:hypothetical protein
MATKAEKILGTLGGILVGGILGNIYAQRNNIREEDQWKYILGGAAAGGLVGYGLASLFGTPDNTVNYKLLKGKETVYHGITFSHRISARETEHKKSGKVFHKMVVKNEAIPRCDALEIERSLIQRDKPKYNIIHNS